jgi:hypothetical protein
MKFYVTFRIHLAGIVGKTLPNFIDKTFEISAEGPKELSVVVSQIMADHAKSQGVVADNPILTANKKVKHVWMPGMIPALNGFDNFIFIPMQMIAWVETITTVPTEGEKKPS